MVNENNQNDVKDRNIYRNTCKKLLSFKRKWPVIKNKIQECFGKSSKVRRKTILPNCNFNDYVKKLMNLDETPLMDNKIKWLADSMHLGSVNDIDKVISIEEPKHAVI